MKFGHNFDDLSIPQWRIHNLDYNHLKGEIRKLTDSHANTEGFPPLKRNLRHLNRAFVEDFDRVSLFAITKYGELSRRLAFQEMAFSLILPRGSVSEDGTLDTASNSDIRSARRRSLVEDQIKVDEILYQCYELSGTTQDLSKFILMQKIACRKIFKKYQKYAQNKKKAQAFVDNLKDYLYTNEHSFFNVDLSSLTLKLAELIRLIKEHRSRLCDDLKSKSYSPTSLIVASMNKLAATNPSPLHVQQKFSSAGTEFDLLTCIKKNFHIDCIIPDETNSVNETILNLNVNLGLDVVDVNQEIAYMSVLFLQNSDQMDEDPSYIISDHSQDVSTVVAHTGGLRKYAYCVLPNDVVQYLLDYLNSKTDKLKGYFHHTTLSLLTKLTIETIIKQKHTPKCRVDFQRHRYWMRKDIVLTQTHSHDESTPSLFEGKTYQDDYYITLDKKIQTTTDARSINILGEVVDEAVFDIFPYAHLMVHSNDSNLSTFVNDLRTPIEDGTIGRSYSSSLLRKLPVKIQDLLTNNNSLTLVKNLSFYHYMLSCYFNMALDHHHINSEYSNLLNLNLLKNYEQVENFKNQRNAENRLLKNNSLQVLHHQNSLKSFSDLHPQPPALKKNDSMLSMATTKDDLSIFTHDYLGRHGLLEELVSDEDSTNEEEDNNYLHYLKLHIHRNNDESIIGDFILRMLRFKKRALSKLTFSSNKGRREYEILSDDLERNYGSTHDNDMSVGQRNLRRIFEEDFDHTLSYFYFSLFFISLFVSGVELGIIYSLLGAQDEDSKLLMSKNLLVVLVLLLGLFVSLIFGMISINLNLQRYYPLTSHTVILWLGFAVVAFASIWCVIVIMEQR